MTFFRLLFNLKLLLILCALVDKSDIGLLSLESAFELVDSGSQLIKRLAGPNFRVYFSRLNLNLRFIALVPVPLVAVSRVSACITVDMTAVSPRLPFAVRFFLPINHVITLTVVGPVTEMVLGSNTPAPPAVPVLALKVLDVYIPSVA